MKRPLLLSLALLVITAFQAQTKNSDKKKIQVTSFLKKEVTLYYTEGNELIGKTPLTIERNAVKNAEIIIRCEGYYDTYLWLPVKQIMDLNISPVESSRITPQNYIDVARLASKPNDTYTIYVKPKLKTTGEKHRINLMKIANKISPGSLLGRNESRLYYMVTEGIAYDPVFGANKALRTDFCTSLLMNGFSPGNCEKLQESYSSKYSRNRKFVAVTPVISKFSFRIFNSQFKDERFAYGYYNLVMKYTIGLDNSEETIEIANEGYFNAPEPHTLFARSMSDNIAVLFSDTQLVKKIVETNALFEKAYKADTLVIKSINTVAVDLKEMIRKSMQSVVTIKADDESFGSGFLINNDGIIITNHHVIDDANKLMVTIGKDTTGYEAEVIKYDEYHDVALIRIKKSNTPFLPLSRSEAYEVGESVFAIGTPAMLELGQSVSKGIVSGNRTIDDHTFIQTDVSINPGNSGGPLLNEKGEVLGVMVMKFVGRGMEGLSFAIPSTKVIELMNIRYR